MRGIFNTAARPLDTSLLSSSAWTQSIVYLDFHLPSLPRRGLCIYTVSLPRDCVA